MSTVPNLSLRVSLASPLRGLGDPAAMARAIADPNLAVQDALTIGASKLVFRAQRERFTGKGPFAPSMRKLGVVTGRLRRDLHAEQAVMIANGYRVRMGATVDYFGAHEVGFSGTVNVKAHRRAAHTVKRKKQTRMSRKGNAFSVRANQFSMLEQSVRAHTRRMDVPARMPLRTAIEEHSARIMGQELARAIRGIMNSQQR